MLDPSGIVYKLDLIDKDHEPVAIRKEKTCFFNGDKRDRSFDTRAELNKRKLNFDTLVLNEAVFMEISYEHTFLDKKEIVNVKRYEWVNNKWKIQ